MSKKIFAANWKMNKTPALALAFAKEVLSKTNVSFYKDREIFIFPQNFSLGLISTELKDTPIFFGPQHVHTEIKGAFTGENSIEAAKSLGSKICLVGHSERRQHFFENNTAINKKIILCLVHGILPVFCFGETAEERQKNQTFEVCFSQISEALTGVDINRRIVLAYEPVWAIGTGQVATIEQVSEVHLKIFDKMNSLGFKDFQILYGGSVKADNAKDLISLPHVDGFLIGGASLEVDSLLAICTSNRC